MKTRCEWAGSDLLYYDYHDHEWGVPEHNDQKLFEMLILEGAQAGLSWITILKKRENYRKAFDNFNAAKIVKYSETKIQELLNNKGIVRNKLKVKAAIQNARGFLEIQKESGTFDTYIWQFVGGNPRKNSFEQLKDLPAKTTESEAMSKIYSNTVLNLSARRSATPLCRRLVWLTTIW